MLRVRTAVITGIVMVATLVALLEDPWSSGPGGNGRGVREAGTGGTGRNNAPPSVAELPVIFEANVGQTDPDVHFLARHPDAGLFLKGSEAVLALRGPAGGAIAAAVRLVPSGANTVPEAVGLEPLPGRVNRMVGADPANWHLGVPTYAKVAQRGVWDGIDIVYYGRGGELEFDFVVAPGADPQSIRLGVEGANSLRIDEHGDLVIDTVAGPLIQRRPVAYQQLAAGRRPVAAEYVMTGSAEVALRLGHYDRSQTLVVDPVLIYSTYLGGAERDEGRSIAVDGSGAAYVTGRAASFDFPTTVGAFDTSSNGGFSDVFVAKLSPTGSSLVYATYLGGSSEDEGKSIAVDSAGAAYLTGTTSSSDFPTTAAAYEPSFNPGISDAFVVKLNPAGSSLEYSTYLGGSGSEEGSGISVDAAGAAYVAGHTFSFNFPTTAGAFDVTHNGDSDGFAAKLSPAGSVLVYSTFLGGALTDRGHDIAVDATGAAYTTGATNSFDFPTTPGALPATLNGAFNAFVTRIDPAGSTLTYSTYLGGGGEDEGAAIAVDGAGSAYVTGYTVFSDFPTTPGAFDTSYNGAGPPFDGGDAFVSKLNASGSALTYSTFLGGSEIDRGLDIALDSGGAAYVAGGTSSTNFPTVDAIDDSYNGGGDSFTMGDAFVTQIDPTGSMAAHSTYLGGAERDLAVGIAVDAGGLAYVTGATYSSDFPTIAGAFDATANGNGDAFVATVGTTTSTSTTTTTTSTTTTSTTTTSTSTTSTSTSTSSTSTSSTTSTTAATTTSTAPLAETLICRILRRLLEFPFLGGILRPLLPLFGCHGS